MSEIVNHSDGSLTFAGPAAVNLYRAVALKTGLAMYMRCGIKPNRAWTPKVMLATAGQITGKTYKARAYAEAVADLEAWIVEARKAVPVRHAD
jgi:hypothetical protein